MITQTRHETGGQAFFADGERFIILTDKTTSEQLCKFNRAAHAIDAELCAAAKAAKEARDWNFANPGKGRNWPAFGRLERLVNNLCKQAGIKDS